MNRKNLTKLIFGLALGAALLAVWYTKFVDPAKVREWLGQVRLHRLAIAAAFYLGAYFMRALRWRAILDPIQKTGVGESYALSMVSYLVNALIPIHAGEFLKSALLKKRHGVRISRSLPTVFIDKFTDLLPIILVIVLVPVLGLQLPLVKGVDVLGIVLKGLAAVLVLGVLFLFLVWYQNDLFVRALHRFDFIIPAKYRDRILEIAQMFVQGLGVIGQAPRQIPVIILLTMAAVGFDTAYVWCLFHAFGVEIAVTKDLFGYTLIQLSFLFPHPPGQIGSLEVLWPLIFHSALGVEEQLVNTVVLSGHCLATLLLVAVGGISLYCLGVKIGSLASWPEGAQEPSPSASGEPPLGAPMTDASSVPTD